MGFLSFTKTNSFLDIPDFVNDYEAMEEVLFQKLFIERRDKLGLMFDCIVLSFRLHGFVPKMLS